MSKSKFGKRQIAGALLLSSTAIGATASGTASASKFTDFMENTKDYLGSKADALWQGTKGLSSTAGNYAVSTMDKVGEILKSGVNKIGDLASNTYNKVAGSKFWEDVGNVAGDIKNKSGDVYNWVKDSKGGQWVSRLAGDIKNKSGDVYDWVKDSKGGQWVSSLAGDIKNKSGDVYDWVKDSKGGQWVSDKAGDIYNWVKDSKVGNFVSDHAWGVAAIGLLSALTYGTYRAIKAGINYYSNKDFRNAKNNLLESIESFIGKIKNDNNTNDPLISNLEALKVSVSFGQMQESALDMDSAKKTSEEIKDEELTELFNKIESNYEEYRKEYDKLNSNK